MLYLSLVLKMDTGFSDVLELNSDKHQCLGVMIPKCVVSLIKLNCTFE